MRLHRLFILLAATVLFLSTSVLADDDESDDEGKHCLTFCGTIQGTPRGMSNHCTTKRIYPT